MNTKTNISNMNRNQLSKFLLSLQERSFRANQLMQWIYHHYCEDFDKMSNIKKNLRNKLKTFSEICFPKISKESISRDGTIKWILKINKRNIETIYIPENKRATLCISSQIGCVLKCNFCATANIGFNRNLLVSEIIGQIWNARKLLNKNVKNKNYPITNIVLMGMGEPLLNFKNVVTAIEIMLDNFGFGFSNKKITISTAGITPAILNLSKVLDVKLAISLHAPNDYLRSKIMPINNKYNIDSVLSAAKYYLSKSKANRGKITIEYVMLDSINDSIEHAYQLIKCLKIIPCKINLIPWNIIPGSNYKCSSNNKIYRFAQILREKKFIVTIRKARGNDINAACGQLKGCEKINKVV